MMRKLLAGLMLIASPIFTGLNANPSIAQGHNMGSEKASTIQTLNKSYKHDWSGDRKCKDGRDGTDGRDGRDGRDCDCNRDDGSGPVIAYYYLRPSDLGGDTTLDGGSSIFWDDGLFTVKTGGIDINSDGNIDIYEPGIYLFTWSVFANSNDSDFITFELQLNGSSVAGSRFTQVNPIANDLNDEGTGQDASELFGQVIIYVPAFTTLSLVNVTGFDEDITVTFENEGGDQGNVASIAVQRLARDFE